MARESRPRVATTIDVDDDGTFSSSSSSSPALQPRGEEEKTEDIRNVAFDLIGEVVSGYRLSYNDGGYDDDEIFAYVTVRYGSDGDDDQVLAHRTKESSAGGRNPIWSLSTDSPFLLSTTPNELAGCAGGKKKKKRLTISAWSNRKDALQLTVIETRLLGTAVLDGATIIENCNEKHFRVPLTCGNSDRSTNDGAAAATDVRGFLTLRLRVATPADKAFVEQCRRRNRRGESGVVTATSAFSMTTSEQRRRRPVAPLVTEVDETEVASKSFVNAVASAFTPKSYYDARTKTHKVLVKPSPDPSRPAEETAYLSEREIKTETMKPSHQWVEAGSSGTAASTTALGKLYLEVLSCHDLPNVDVGEAVGNLSDCFVCGVFEDAMVETPVIDDELSPYWLPWTQRAFVFGMKHPASVLYLGVFDYGKYTPIVRSLLSLPTFLTIASLFLHLSNRLGSTAGPRSARARGGQSRQAVRRYGVHAAVRPVQQFERIRTDFVGVHYDPTPNRVRGREEVFDGGAVASSDVSRQRPQGKEPVGRPVHVLRTIRRRERANVRHDGGSLLPRRARGA